MSKSSLKKTLGIIKQEDEKQQSPYDSIVNLLRPDINLSGQQNFQSTILKQLDNFHKFYNKRYEQSKENYERINKQNWQYAGKIIKYEKLLQNYQMMYNQSKRVVNFMEQKLKQSQIQSQRINNQLSAVINLKNQQINELKSQLKKVRNKGQSKSKSKSKRIVRLKDKSLKIDHNESVNTQTVRSYRQFSVYKNQIDQQADPIQELKIQNDCLKTKVKHLQADRKYQNERLKNATLGLQLDLKIKNQQIQRLNNQIQIYQKKFQELIQTLKTNNFSNLSQISKISNRQQKYQTLATHFYEWQQNEQGQNNSFDQKDGQMTQRKFDIQDTEKKAKKYHKRYGSLNLEQFSNKKQNEKQDLNMKIKIFKYNKNKKCV